MKVLAPSSSASIHNSLIALSGRALGFHQVLAEEGGDPKRLRLSKWPLLAFGFGAASTVWGCALLLLARRMYPEQND